MDEGWGQRDFHWLARPDSVAGGLLSPKPAGELGRGQAQTFFFPPELLARLQDRLFTGKVSFRMTGPSGDANNLFSWDSGFGAESLERGPLLRIVAGPPPDVPPPSPTPDYVIITPVSDVAGIIALAAERLTATAVAVVDPNAGTPAPTATSTPLPPNWVTPVIVVPTHTPENAATAYWQAQVATAQAIVQGTPTPLPPNAWTATPTPGPTPTPALVLFGDLTPTATATATPTGIPDLLRGKILFRSDRLGGDTIMVMNPDGSDVAVWTGGGGEWIYQQAKLGQDISPDGRFRVLVSDRQLGAVATNPLPTFQLFIVPLQEEGRPQRITDLAGMSYDAVWSPAEYRIAFVSLGPGNDEIFTIRPDGTELERLTFNDWEWDKHPNWSPDGSQLVFWSNRDTARKQIWVMNADGSGQQNLSSNEFNDWDPVWVK